MRVTKTLRLRRGMLRYGIAISIVGMMKRGWKRNAPLANQDTDVGVDGQERGQPGREEEIDLGEDGEVESDDGLDDDEQFLNARRCQSDILEG